MDAMSTRRALPEAPFLAAATGGKPSRVPVWFMRQAGRSLPEYLALREGVAMLEACSNAELITEITLQPVRRYGVDAAILYSDIMTPVHAIGFAQSIPMLVAGMVLAADAILAAHQARDFSAERFTEYSRALREGLEIVEEKARSDLGMVKADEILVQYAK